MSEIMQKQYEDTLKANIALKAENKRLEEENEQHQNFIESLQHDILRLEQALQE